MRILYITQTFPPEPGATHRPLGHAIRLEELGHDVTVLTTFPYFPAGRLAPKDRWRAIRVENHQRVRVIRVASLPAANRGTVTRMASFASFGVAALLAGLRLRKCELVIASIPHFFTEWPGCILAKIWKARLVLELRDLLPDSTLLTGVDPQSWPYRLAKHYFRWLYRLPDVIAVPFRGMFAPLTVDYQVSAARILLLPHGVDEGRFSNAASLRRTVRRHHGWLRDFVVLYAGSFSSHYGVLHIARAVEYLPTHTHIRVVLVGEGRDRSALMQLVRSMKSTRIDVLEAVSPDEIGGYLAAADAFIAPLKYDNTARYQPDRSTKVCEYLAHGRPIIAVEASPCIGALVTSVGAGVHIPWGDHQALASEMCAQAEDRQRYEQMSESARDFATRELSRDCTMADLCAWIDAGGGGGRS